MNNGAFLKCPHSIFLFIFDLCPRSFKTQKAIHAHWGWVLTKFRQYNRNKEQSVLIEPFFSLEFNRIVLSGSTFSIVKLNPSPNIKDSSFHKLGVSSNHSHRLPSHLPLGDSQRDPLEWHSRLHRAALIVFSSSFVPINSKTVAFLLHSLSSRPTIVPQLTRNHLLAFSSLPFKHSHHFTTHSRRTTLLVIWFAVNGELWKVLTGSLSTSSPRTPHRPAQPPNVLDCFLAKHQHVIDPAHSERLNETNSTITKPCPHYKYVFINVSQICSVSLNVAVVWRANKRN